MSGDRFDRRGLGVLATGHLWADFLQGAIPALLPFLIAEHGYSYGAAGALLLAASLGSSIVQPLFGVASDRFSLPWLMPFGLALGGAGLARGRADRELRGDVRGGGGERPRRRGVPPGGARAGPTTPAAGSGGGA